MNYKMIVAFIIGWNIVPLIRWNYTGVDLGGTMALMMVLVAMLVADKFDKK
jgi:hypothetical protein